MEDNENKEIEQWNKQREEQIKENWKEIEQSNFNREEEMKEKYGIDITKLHINPKIDKVSKVIEKTGKAVGIIIKVVYFLIIIMAYLVVILYYKNIREMQKDNNSNLKEITKSAQCNYIKK